MINQAPPLVSWRDTVVRHVVGLLASQHLPSAAITDTSLEAVTYSACIYANYKLRSELVTISMTACPRPNSTELQTWPRLTQTELQTQTELHGLAYCSKGALFKQVWLQSPAGGQTSFAWKHTYPYICLWGDGFPCIQIDHLWGSI